MNKKNQAIHIIGAGLAGSDAAWSAANAGAEVILHEMRPQRQTEVHKTGDFAELVCSNSFRSDDAQANAVGLLHEEMRRMGSLVMKCADAHKVPAGSALAVDREGFAKAVTNALKSHPNIEIQYGEIAGLPPHDWANVIIATGPLTTPALSAAIQEVTGEDELAFFDAIAPIVYKDSIDFDVCWFQSRYDKPGPGGSGADYINCPLDKTQYENFIDGLLAGDATVFSGFEDTPYFDGCLPIEVMAQRGRETLRHGPMKPRGLTNAHRPDEKPYGVVQLRQDNALGSLYNMVGFQTKLKYGAQADLFKTIPGLENARFARLGGLHRNTFLNSPNILNEDLTLNPLNRLRFAGQITGVEGYVESASIGIMAGLFAACDYFAHDIILPDANCAFGALLNHITRGHILDNGKQARSFQPMNINFGLLPETDPPADSDGKRLRGKPAKAERRRMMSERALQSIDTWRARHQFG